MAPTSPSIGPILFYLQALVFKFSVAKEAARFAPAVWGILLGLTVLLFFRKESKPIAYSVAILFLVSPNLLYYSRFLVHTAIVILFNLCFILTLRNFFRSFRSSHLFWAAGFLALAFGTSETTYILMAVMLIFIPIYYLANRTSFKLVFGGLKKYLKSNIFDVLSAILIFAIGWLIIYSVGLTNLESLRISLPNPFAADSSLGFWLAQHPVRLGGQPWFYYVLLTIVYEILPLATFLIFVPRVVKNRRPFELFLIWWTVGTFGVFSWAGEKFPWLFLPSLLALTFSAGFFLGRYWEETRRYLKIILLVILIWTLFVSIRLNYLGSDDTRELSVYVQTPQSFEKVEDKIREKCEGKSADCLVLDAKITWPMAWDLERINRLEDFSSKSQINNETEFLLVEPGSELPSNLTEKFSKKSVQLRDWWVPTKYQNTESIIDYLKYFISRKIWNEKGGFDIHLYEKK